MSSPNLPKAILMSPDLNETNEDASLKAITNMARLNEMIRGQASYALKDVHQNRIKNLRKELEYLKETEWKYEPIEKYIGQSY